MSDKIHAAMGWFVALIWFTSLVIDGLGEPMDGWQVFHVIAWVAALLNIFFSFVPESRK